MTAPGRTPAPTDPAWPPPPSGWRHDAPDPPEAFPVPFTVFDGLALVLWSIAAQILVGTPLVLAGFEFGSDAASMLVLIVVEFVILGGALGWLASRGRLSWRVLGPVRPSRRLALVGLGIGVVGFVIVTVLVEAVNRLVGPIAPPDQALLDSTAAGGLTTVLSAIVAVVLAPVVEEFIFRGALFQALRRRLGLWPGVGLSSLAWAVVHVEVFDAVYLTALFVLGAWLAATFHRTGSLVVPIVGHATFNGVVVLLTLAAPSVTS